MARRSRVFHSPHEPSKDPIVFVVDDDPNARKTMDALGGSIGLGVQTYSSAKQFLRYYDRDDPGCLILEVSLPDMSGLDLQAELAKREIDLPIIMTTDRVEIPAITQAMRAGALDVMQKPFDRDALLVAIKKAIHEDELRRNQRARHAEFEALATLLTEREQQIMKRLIQALSTKQIAAELHISTKTVDNHRTKILEKMQVDSVPELILLVMDYAE